MTFTFEVPELGGVRSIQLEPGSTVVFVGANGSGKTRLAAAIESNLGLRAHRIAAHRALILNTDVPKISEELALQGLRTGFADRNSLVDYREGRRWSGNKEVGLLNDFDFVLQALFAEQSNTALTTHTAARAGTLTGPIARTKFEQLKTIWERLLPSRAMVLSADSIQVQLLDGTVYSASKMSDGERAIFYMLGQALAAAKDSVLIVDEPELHVHPSIMSSLWDEVQLARLDCGLVFITHDLQFAASRPGQKFVVRDYKPLPQWVVEPVPLETGFDEETVTLILGSRQPVLFVEGTESSIDLAMYRACFRNWTVIPRGSCEEVIHSVVTMRRNASMTRVTCSGLVDADDYSDSDVLNLAALGIAVLPVSEIENMVLLPNVSRAIAGSEAITGTEADVRLQSLKEAVFAVAGTPRAVEEVVARYCRRRIDRQLKKIDLSGAATIGEIATEYSRLTSELDVTAIANAARMRIASAIALDDLPALLKSFDNKGGLLAAAASYLKGTRKDSFEEWLVRVLQKQTHQPLIDALRHALPQLEAR